MSPPTTTTTFPLTPPFSPTTTTQRSFHPLSRVETLELDGPSIHEEEEEDDYTADEEESDSDEDEMRPAYNNTQTTKQQFMDGEGEGLGGWKEKGTGGTGKLRVVIVTGESTKEGSEVGERGEGGRRWEREVGWLVLACCQLVTSRARGRERAHIWMYAP